MKIQLSIADDHPMIIEGIQKILTSYPKFEVIATYTTGTALLEGLQHQQPDILLLDLHFPNISGNELVRKILPQYPQLKILIVTSVDDPFEVQDMIQNGCSGYILKTADRAIIIEAIDKIYNGDTYIEASLKEAMVQVMLNPKSKNIAQMKLTAKEQQVLEMICQGLTNMEIGDKLFLSHRTIEHYRVTLYDKFGVNNTASLVKFAVQNKIIK